MSEIEAAKVVHAQATVKKIVAKKPGFRRLEGNKSVWDLANSKKRCYVCTKLLEGNPSNLMKATTKHSNQTFATCLREIANNQFNFEVNLEDRCCSICAALIQARDKAMQEVDRTTKTLFTYLRTSSTIRSIGSNKSSGDSSNVPANVLESYTISVNQENQPVVPELKVPPAAPSVLYQCQACQKLFSSLKDVGGHKCRGKTADAFVLSPESAALAQQKVGCLFRCRKCGSKFASLTALSLHEKSHHPKTDPQKDYSECKKCRLQFPSKAGLEKHMESHQRYKCIPCGVRFKTKKELLGHITLTAKLLHAEYCVTCNKVFDSKAQLDAHLKQQHSQTDPNEHVALRIIYQCQCCQKEVPEMKNFEAHKNSHSFEVVDDDEGMDNDVLVLAQPAKQTQPATPVKKVTPPAAIIIKKPVEKTQLSTSILDHSYSLSSEQIESHSPEIQNTSPVKVEVPVALSSDDESPAKEPNVATKPIIKPPTTPKPPPEPRKKVYECGMCDIRANTLPDLMKHFQSHKDKPIQCKHCNINLPSIASLSKHLLYHMKSTQGLDCTLCQRPLASKDQMMKHYADVHRMKHQCQFCGEQFRYMSELNTHKMLHPDARQFMCLFCDERFISAAQLDKHQTTTHRDPKCGTCGKEIHNRKKLREHELRHLKPVCPCPKCERIFRTPAGLVCHMATHTGVYKFKCDTCNKGYMNKKVFVEHVNSHLEHPHMLYNCRFCEREFAYQGSLWIHEKWHQNPFPYQCHLCGKKLRHASILQTHLRKHRGEKPYKCPHCNLAFYSSSSFKRHMMLHTGVFPYNCAECKKGFTTKQKFNKHQFDFHGVPIPEKPQKTEYKISLGIPPMADTTFAEDEQLQLIVQDLSEVTDADQVMQHVMEVVTDEQQQAVATLTLLDEASWMDTRQ